MDDHHLFCLAQPSGKRILEIPAATSPNVTSIRVIIGGLFNVIEKYSKKYSMLVKLECWPYIVVNVNCPEQSGGTIFGDEFVYPMQNVLPLFHKITTISFLQYSYVTSGHMHTAEADLIIIVENLQVLRKFEKVCIIKNMWQKKWFIFILKLITSKFLKSMIF